MVGGAVCGRCATSRYNRTIPRPEDAFGIPRSADDAKPVPKLAAHLRPERKEQKRSVSTMSATGQHQEGRSACPSEIQYTTTLLERFMIGWGSL